MMDIMMMKKTKLEENVQHYKAEGVKLTGLKQLTIEGVCRKILLACQILLLCIKAQRNLLGESCSLSNVSYS